jgi:hypothetical protein
MSNRSGQVAMGHNVSRLGEVAEHKTSLELQIFKLKIKCQTNHKTAILPNRC